MYLIHEHGSIKILREGEPLRNVVFILRYKDEFKRQIWMRLVSKENYTDKETFAVKALIKDSMKFSDTQDFTKELQNMYDNLFNP